MRLHNILSVIVCSFLCMYLTGCTSPYAARGIQEIQGLEASYIAADTAEITIAHDFPKDCEYRRNALLLKAAYIALYYNYDHFEFTSDEDVSKLRYEPIRLDSPGPIKVFLCRGTCPVMYSAKSISHILVSKFSHPTWESSSANRQDEKCYLKSKG